MQALALIGILAVAHVVVLTENLLHIIFILHVEGVAAVIVGGRGVVMMLFGSTGASVVGL